MSRNVEALARLICERHEGAVEFREAQGFCPDCRLDAEYLATRGVLAVDAVTDEQAKQIAPIDAWSGMGEGWSWESPDELRAALRRLATGEPD